jgi:dual specificity phosphatase 12
LVSFLQITSLTHTLNRRFSVSVCHEEIPAQRRDSPIAHFRIPIDDVDNADLLIWLPSACLFIQTALAGGGVVLVHSTLGQSRSAAVVAAYCAYILLLISHDCADN